ncbi:MAG: helix-turn-helix domain-containing protein [Lachnospiraceae bacterium]|nr:helix-turn-helix domain-containing protein [Lachnospiraceae bacterium]
MEFEERINLFQNMVHCCHNLYLWNYDCAMHLISTDCPEPEAIHNLFAIQYQQSSCHGELAEADTPLLLPSEMGLMWFVIPRIVSGDLLRIYVLGPFFVDDISPKSIQLQLEQHGITASLRKKVISFLKELPVISWSRAQEYAIMLYYCITEHKIDTSSLRYCQNNRGKSAFSNSEMPSEVHGTYQMEQEMLRMVREGDLNLEAQLTKMSVTGNIGKLSNGESLRQMKNAVLVCTTLFSRAAIEGGLSPELSFTLTDQYFQAVEASADMSELTEVTRKMQSDFVQRVHHCHTEKLSPPIRTCYDFIKLHLDEEISMQKLAAQIGYADHYLNKKFKKETGSSPAEFIRTQRLRRAALLLRTTNDDVQDISDRLQFGSPSYFSDSFKKMYGVSPSEYRLTIRESEDFL